MSAGRRTKQTRGHLVALEHKKAKLMELAGINTESAFQRVREIERFRQCGWLNAYDVVIKELEQAKKESK